MKKYVLKEKGLLILAVLFGIIFSVGSTLIALILKDIIDVAMAKDMDKFVFIIVQTVIYLCVISLFYGLYSALSKKFVCKVMKMLRADIFEGVFKKNIPDFKSVNSADYLSALTNDVKNVEDNYFMPLLLCMQNIIVFITSFAVMIYLSPLVMLCLFAAMFLLIAVPCLFQKTIQSRQDDFSKKQSAFTVAVKDFLSGFEVIRSYKMHSHIVKAFADKNNTIFQTKYSLDKIVSIVEALSALLSVVVQCSVLFVSAYLIITGEITAGVLVGLVQVSGTIVVPIQILSQNLPKIQGCKPIINRLNSISQYNDTAFSGAIAPTFVNSIAVNSLQFGYSQDNYVVNGINFVFKKNFKYALVGKSGCGKTTLINLLNGCYANFSGKIMYDNEDIRNLDIEKINEFFSVIHQNVYMFDESIKNNICLHKNVSQADLQKALSMSGIDMFLCEDKTIDTQVGENGNNLSGGQRQRVAVARALVQEKPVLVLDEGTSAVDMQTAYDIESRLLKIKDLTVITITHSLNPQLLKNYDQIIFMEEGNIVEADTFENLVSAQGKFYDFFSLKK